MVRQPLSFYFAALATPLVHCLQPALSCRSPTLIEMLPTEVTARTTGMIIGRSPGLISTSERLSLLRTREKAAQKTSV